MKKVRAFLLALLFTTNAWAIIPENGWWWASNESGRGFNIEVQDHLLFFATFAYETNGSPMWLIAGGAMTSDRDFTGPLTKFTSGQCFGCPYVTPVAIPAGTMTLRFTSSQTAVLTINGSSITVKRFDFRETNEVAPDAMMGEWSSIIGESGTSGFLGERVQYRVKLVDSTGPFLSGSRLGESSATAVVSYSSSAGQWTALLDSSAGFWRYFVFNQTGFNRIEGSFWVVAKGSTPSGTGEFFQAYRTASANFVTRGFGPASTKATEAQRAAQDGIDAAALAAMASKARAASPIGEELVASFRELEARAKAAAQ